MCGVIGPVHSRGDRALGAGNQGRGDSQAITPPRPRRRSKRPTRSVSSISVEEKANPLLALRVRSFRLYWLALVAQVVGQQMFAFTLGWLTFEITGSQAQLGFIHLCGFAPQFALTLLGGVLADRVDARKLIGAAQTNAAIAMIFVGVAAMFGAAQLWHLALGAFLLGLTNAITSPRARRFSRACCLGHCCAPRCRSSPWPSAAAA